MNPRIGADLAYVVETLDDIVAECVEHHVVLRYFIDKRQSPLNGRFPPLPLYQVPFLVEAIISIRVLRTQTLEETINAGSAVLLKIHRLLQRARRNREIERNKHAS